MEKIGKIEVKYLLSICKNIKDLISDSVVLKLNNDYPLMIEYLIDGFKINYLLLKNDNKYKKQK